jgi:hypothetical protein
MPERYFAQDCRPQAGLEPVKFGTIEKVHICLLITGGVPSLVAEESSARVSTTVVDTGTGIFTVDIGVGGTRCVGASGSVEAPAAGGTQAAPTVGYFLDLTAGTVEVNTYAGATLTDPTTLSKVRLTLELSER